MGLQKILGVWAFKEIYQIIVVPKMRIMRSGTILSAAADIFQHQCIQVSVDAAVMLDDEASCNSSLSCYSENTSDSDNFGYFQSISVAY
ncbi:hypothetical protein HJC23_007947 [Cyclotella cryptica]|uniref:Uncharacterized protein n=1 Tax=Cyclotella cryptica TaxID=29204 RepID=A0ABD3PCY3_9STRA